MTFTSDERGKQDGVVDGGHLKQHPKDQYSTMLVAVAIRAALALRPLQKGSVNVKLCVEELVRFGCTMSQVVRSFVRPTLNDRASSS